MMKSFECLVWLDGVKHEAPWNDFSIKYCEMKPPTEISPLLKLTYHVGWDVTRGHTAQHCGLTVRRLWVWSLTSGLPVCLVLQLHPTVQNRWSGELETPSWLCVWPCSPECRRKFVYKTDRWLVCQWELGSTWIHFFKKNNKMCRCAFIYMYTKKHPCVVFFHDWGTLGMITKFYWNIKLYT